MFSLDYSDGRHQGYGRSRRLDLLHSFFVNGHFSLQNCGHVHIGEDFDPKYLERQFSLICEDFLQPLKEGTLSTSLGFCDTMVFQLNPFFRENREGNNAHVLCFFGEVVRQVVIVPYRADLALGDLGTVFKEDGKLILKLSLTQGMYLAMRVLGHFINMNPQLVILSPSARATFLNTTRVQKLAADLGLSYAEITKMVNFSCVSRAGHHLEGADASCALINTLHTTREISDRKRRLAMVAKLMRPYVDRGLIPDLDRAVIFEKYAAPE